MKNEKSLISVVFLSIVLTSLIAVSCVANVSQEEYDKLAAELSAAQAQVEALQSDLESAQSRIALLEEKITRAKAQADIISGLFVPALTGELNEMTSAESTRYFLEWRDQVEASGDILLKDKFQTLMDAEFANEGMMDFFLYLFENLPKTLE